MSLEYGNNGCYFIASDFGNNYGDKDTVAIEIEFEGVKNTYCINKFEGTQIIQHLINQFGIKLEEVGYG